MGLFLAAAAVAVSVPILWWAVWGGRSQAATARHLLSDLAPAEAAMRLAAVPPKAGGPLGGLGGVLRRVLPDGIISALEKRALLAGMAGGHALDGLLTAKVAGGVVGLLVGLASATSGMLKVLAMFGLPALGYFGPDLALTMRGRQRQTLIRRSLADFLDQITVSVEAGLGFEGAMARTGRSAKGPLAEELLRTLQDIQAGMSRGEALRRLADRTDVPDLRHFVLAVRQAEDYGVPIAQVLRVQAADLRLKRRQAAEERAMKLPVKMIFPLIFCILPALFVVLLGPGALRFLRTGLTGG